MQKTKECRFTVSVVVRFAYGLCKVVGKLHLVGRAIFVPAVSVFFLLAPSLTIRKRELEVIPFNVGTFDKSKRERLEIIKNRIALIA